MPDTDARQYRDDEDEHHPGRQPERFREARMKQPTRRDRCGQQQAQIVGQKERRQRRHDGAEGQEREERQEQPRQSQPQQIVAEIGEVAELHGQPE